MGKEGKIAAAQNQKFQYLLLTKPEKWGLGVEEFRGTLQGGLAVPTGLKEGFMLTEGFASASLLLHPAYQSGASFRYLGRQRLNGTDTYVLAIAQKPETARMMERFNMNNVSVLILFQGVAWIDASNYQILRLRTDLLKPQPAVRLLRQTTEIKYAEVPFKDISSKLWLPLQVTVTVDWNGKVLRNSHAYSDFRLFNVQTKERLKAGPAVPPPTTN